MGKLIDQFAGLKYNNEAEVSQNFILPLLQNYLGYSLNEIKPEEHYPARDLHSGVNTEKGGSKGLTHRPDFVICLNGNTDEPRFIIDSKAPSENIDEHFGQLRSYANSVGRNFLMMTNGTEIKVFDVNVLLFYSDSMESLQNKLDHLMDLLGRDSQAFKSHFEILSNLNYAGSIGITQEDEFNMQVNKNRLILSDFRIYLQNIRDQFRSWHLPINNFQAINNLIIQKINPHHHLAFKHYLTVKERYERESPIKLTQIQREYNLNIKVFVGNTGTGKTTLLRYLTYFNAQNCLDFRDVSIPVYIPLREIGHNYNLEFLIERQLNNGGYICSSFRDLPGKNRFVFLLDAYDEISEGLRRETYQAIENLSQKYECFVTTRPSIVPQFTPSEIFEILPISEEQIEQITRAYIDNGYYDFKNKIESNNLKEEAGNTLLLLFLISIFKETGSLPGTATKIINDIVTRVKKWQEAKSKQNGHLNWATLAEFLSAIAYRIAEVGEANLRIDDAEEVIVEIQMEMEVKRKIPANLTVEDIINNLKQTGLIISTNDQIYFWHRLFLDYFAAFGLKRDFQKDHNIIHRLVNQQKWEMILVGLSSLLADSSDLIGMVKGEIWLAAYCLSENMNCSLTITKEIVDGLINQLRSPVQSLRKRALGYLARIGNEQANEFLYTVFDRDYPADVRMIALSNIAKHKSPEAKKIIYDHLDWNEGDFFRGTSSQAHVLYGLSCFDEPEHLQIIKNWEKYRDYMATMTCERIFLELHAKNRLSGPVIVQLKEFFIRNFQLNKQGGEKVNALGKILSKFQDEDLALQVLELAYIHADISKQDSVYMLLKSINSIKVINVVKDKIFKLPEPYYIAENCAKAICHSVCDIPKEIYFELIEHPNKNIGSMALQALTKFDFNDVKEVISKHLDGENGQLQSAALEVAVENAEIISLFRNNTLPEFLYLPTIHTILDAIRRYNLTEAKPTLKNIAKWISEEKRYIEEYHLAFHLAKTCHYIGEGDIHDAVVKLYFNGSVFLQNDEHLHNNLMKSLKEMDRGIAIEIAKCYYRKYFPAPEDKYNYETEVFIETTEELQYPELNVFLKEIVEDMIRESKNNNESAIHRLERPLRALVLLGTSSDEEWIISHLDDFKYQFRPDQAQLRRALECLAQFGTIKALSHIKTIAQEYSSDESLVNVSQVAYESICSRANLSVPEKALFESN